MSSVLVWGRAGAFFSPGGGETQLLQTVEALQHLGCEVALFDPWKPQTSAAILHIFGSYLENYNLIVSWKSMGMPVVVSPILFHLPIVHALRTRDIAVIKQTISSYSPRKTAMLSLADVLLPNSASEQALLRRHGLRNKIVVVPNGVDTKWADLRSEEGGGKERRILVLGRFEPRKNQLRLIEKLRGLECRSRSVQFKCLIAGKAMDPNYFAKCKQAAAVSSSIEVVEFDSPYASEEHLKLFDWATTVCLPAWYETPGLTGIEALLSGKEVWATRFGATKDYFGKNVSYIDPFSFRELTYLLSCPIRNSTDAGVLISWESVGEQLMEIYRDLGDEG